MSGGKHVGIQAMLPKQVVICLVVCVGSSGSMLLHCLNYLSDCCWLAFRADNLFACWFHHRGLSVWLIRQGLGTVTALHTTDFLLAAQQLGLLKVGIDMQQVQWGS